MINKNKSSNHQLIPNVKLSTRNLLYLAVVCLVVIILNLSIFERHDHPKRKIMIRAADQMIEAISRVSNLRIEKDLPINITHDPLRSGFIGTEFSPITTTLGSLPAKQTALNPDFAALYIHWFNQLGLENGDRVVIHASGSFPALSISAIIAVQKFGLEPLIFSSAGASSFGANLSEFTYWDIENTLFLKDIIHFRTQYATPGGQNDNGMSFWEGGMQIVKEAAQRNQYPLHIPPDLQAAIDDKIKIMQQFEPFQLFINIGGNQAAMGRSPCGLDIPVGLITSTINCDEPNSGLIQLVNKRGIPVIHMLDIREIAVQHGISLEPERIGTQGESQLYTTEIRHTWLIAGSPLFVLLNLAIVIKNYRNQVSHL